MKGKQLKGLIKVITPFGDLFDARRNDIVNHDHTICCYITPKSGDIFGIPIEGTMHVTLLSRLDIDPKDDYDVSIEDGMYTLTSEKEKISLALSGQDETDSLKEDMSKYDRSEDSFVTQSSELKQAVKRLSKTKAEYIDITGGRLIADSMGIKLSLLLKESECEARSKFRLELLKKVVNVTSGYVMVSYGNNTLLNLKWSDEYYEYNVLIAGCFVND